VIPAGSKLVDEWGKSPVHGGPIYDHPRMPAVSFQLPNGDSIELANARDRRTGARAISITVNSKDQTVAEKSIFVAGSIFFNPKTGEVSAVSKKPGDGNQWIQRDLMSTVNSASERNGVLANVADVMRYLKGLK
jgi:hypothetical protein